MSHRYARRAARHGLGAALLVAAALPALGANVEVTVVDDGGKAVQGALVLIRPPSLHDAPTRGAGVFRRGVTDMRGSVTFTGLDPDQYAVRVSRLPDPLLVPPAADPGTPPPLITVTRRDEIARLRVVVRRGVPVVFRITDDRGRLRSARLRIRETDLGHEQSWVVSAERDLERALLPGRWEVLLEPPQGFLLSDVEVDGRSIEGFRPVLEIQRGSPTRYVTWYFSAPCRVSGTVHFEDERIGVWIEALLVEPGPWIEQAERRGGSSFRSVRAGLDDRDRYEMVLPDGTWRLRARGPDVESADPPAAELELRPGDEDRVDFVVRGDADGARGSLIVDVLGPTGRRIEDAAVEVWPLAEAERGSEPAARAVVRYRAMVRGLEAGDWLIAAAHPEFLEGTEELLGYEPDPDKPGQATVRLERAIRVHGVARDDKDEPVPGVRLSLARTDDGPQTIVAKPEIREALRNPQATSDASGHAWIESAWPGPYRATAELTGPRAGTRFVRFQPERGAPVDELELELTPGTEERKVEMVVQPAANLTGELVCLTDRRLPGAASLVAVPGVEDPDDEAPPAERLPADGDAAEQPWPASALWLPDQPLRGERRNGFVAGPLEADAYRFAVRPAGFDRWTWAPGAEQRARASAIPVAEGEAVDLGILPIDCGPAIRIAPRVTGKLPLPDLRELGGDPDLVVLDGTVTHDRRDRRVQRATVEADRDSVVLRELPEGQARLEVTLVHGYFLPTPDLTFAVEGPLEPGLTLHAAPVVPGIGGMVEVRVEPRTAAAARLLPENGPARVTPTAEGVAVFPSVPAGPHRVELCADAACATVLRAWDDVAVEPLTTVTLR